MLEVLKKLSIVQSELKAPKGRQNTFGKYSYRSCEDILEAVKPVLSKNGCVIVLDDDVYSVDGRFYIKAAATFYDCESGQSIESSALAREDEHKKGMDDAQLTGSCSSYARKYALNALLLIDDTKDADSDETIQATIEWARSKGHTSEQVIEMMKKKNGDVSPATMKAIREALNG